MSSIGAVIHAAAAVKAAQKKQKTAVQLATEAAQELHVKTLCIEFEKENRANKNFDFVTPSKTPLSSRSTGSGFSIVAGDYVFVTPDLSPGKCCHGGNGYVVDFDGSGPNRTFTVKYLRSSAAGNTTESGIPYSRLTVIPNPAFELTNSKRKRKAPELSLSDISATDSDATEVIYEEPLDEKLQKAWRANKGYGWRAKELRCHDDA